mgnify:FL=1
MKAKFYLVVVLLSLMLFLSGCNGVGNLRVNVYNNHDYLMNDVYVGLYTANFNKRIDFKYTTRGEVQFKALEPGSYGLKLVKNNSQKKLRVQVQSDETNHLKVDLE